MSTPPPDGPDTTSAASGTQAPPPPPPPTSGPRVSREEMKDLGRLRRSLTDRKIAGVAGGIARHFDIDPLVVRVALVVLVLFGGGGVLLYGVAWLLVPDDAGDAVVRIDDRSRSVALTIVGVLALLSVVGDAFGGWDFPWPLPVIGVVLIIVLMGRRRHGWHGRHHQPWHGSWQGAPGTEGAVRNGPPWAQPGTAETSVDAEAPAPTYAGYEPPAPPAPARRDPRRRGPVLFGFALALGVFALGVLATGDLAGVDVPVSAYPATVLATCGVMLVVGAFWGRAGGLILVGLLAAFATLVTSLVDGLDAGRLVDRPTTAAALESSYDLDAGEIEIDLTRLDAGALDALDGRTLDLEATFGHLVLIVPDEGLDIRAESTIDGGGETVMFGDRVDGSTDGTYDGGASVPQLTVDARLVFGQIEFRTEEAAA